MWRKSDLQITIKKFQKAYFKAKLHDQILLKCFDTTRKFMCVDL